MLESLSPVWRSTVATCMLAPSGDEDVALRTVFVSSTGSFLRHWGVVAALAVFD